MTVFEYIEKSRLNIGAVMKCVARGVKADAYRPEGMMLVWDTKVHELPCL